MTTPARRVGTKKVPVQRAQPHKPAGVKQPQDHKPPAQAEAEGDEFVEFEHNGITYTAPANLDKTKGVARLLDERRGTMALEKLLGPDEYKKFIKTDPFDSEYGEMLDAWAVAAGFESEGN